MLRLTDQNLLYADMLALLPEVEQDDLVADSAKAMAAEAERRLVFVLSADQPKDLSRISAEFAAYLEQTRQFASDTDSFTQTSSLFAYRYQLLLAPQVRKLEQSPDVLVDQALAGLYGAFGALRAGALMSDPFGLHLDYMASFARGLDLLNGQTPVFKAQGRTWALHSVRLIASSFEVADPARVQRLLDGVRSWAGRNQATLHMTGLPMFAAHGAASAYAEISLFGSLSIVLITLLLLGVFRSLRPLALTIVSVGSGVVAAFAVTVAVFGQVHVLTLVFGSSLIGICVDYALHYLCRWFDLSWTPQAALTKVLPGIALGLLSSVAAFASLLVTPFPGLRQIAVFSAVGLSCAWLTVVLLLPVLTQRKPSDRTPALMRLARAYQDHWPFVPRSVALLLVVVAAGIAFYGIGSLHPSDDIRLLQSVPAALLEEDKLVRDMLPGQFESQFMLVKGADDEQVWAREQQLSQRLRLLAAGSQLESFRALSDHYPVEAVQQANYDLIHRTLYASGRLTEMYAKIGIAEQAGAAHMQQVDALAGARLSFDRWLAGIPADWRAQWLGCNPQGCASVVRLSGIAADPQAMQLLASESEGVRYVDQVADLSALLGRYREVASLLLAGVYALISLLLVWRIGLKAALGVACVPFAACVVAVASVHFMGNLFSLFNLFALLLVVGISIDYAIFFYLAEADNSTTALAVSLSAVTTLLGFGMLSVSSTEVVHAFGQTLTAGLATAFVLAPFASPLVRARLFNHPVSP